MRNYPADPRSKLHPRDPRRKMHPKDPRLHAMLKETQNKEIRYEAEMASAASKVVKEK